MNTIYHEAARDHKPRCLEVRRRSDEYPRGIRNGGRTMSKSVVAGVACMLATLAGARGLAGTPLLDPVFGRHVVLQRDRPIPIWGSAAPGEQVTVTLSGSTRSVRADGNG